MNWNCKSFDELTNLELYKILKLRSEVFVVEQNCPYLDCDDKDQNSYHLWALENNEIIAYARLIRAGISYPNKPSIGRVVTSQNARMTGIGRELMKIALEKCEELFGRQTIMIGAQLYLKKFYESFGFEQKEDVYLEDGIEHIKMVRY